MFVCSVLYKGGVNDIYFVKYYEDLHSVNYFARKNIRNFIKLAIKEAVKVICNNEYVIFNNDQFKVPYLLYILKKNNHYSVIITNNTCNSYNYKTMELLIDSHKSIVVSDYTNNDVNLLKTINFNSKTNSIIKSIDETKKQMSRNVEIILQRGEKLEILEEKTNHMIVMSCAFEKYTSKSCCNLLRLF